MSDDLFADFFTGADSLEGHDDPHATPEAPEAATEAVEPIEPWRAFIRLIVARREQPAFRGERAELRRGDNPTTAHYALAHVASAGIAPEHHQAMTRAAAITAKHIDAPPGKLPLGRSLALTTLKRRGQWPNPSPGDRDTIAQRISMLPLQNFDQAAQNIDLLVGLCATEGVPVSYEDIAHTLINWGTGLTEQSRKTRNQIAVDYYTPRKAAK